MPRTPRGDEPLNITVATKATESEREALIEQYGSVYAGLRAAIDCVTQEDDS